MNAVKGGVSNMVDLAEWKAFWSHAKWERGEAGNVLDIDDKAASAQNAPITLENDAVPELISLGRLDIPEPPIDPGTTMHLLSIQLLQSKEWSPHQDPNPPADAIQFQESTPPAQPDSSQQKFRQSMNQMNYMNQQNATSRTAYARGTPYHWRESDDEEE